MFGDFVVAHNNQKTNGLVLIQTCRFLHAIYLRLDKSLVSL